MSPLKKTPREIELEAELEALREARKTRDEKILKERAAKKQAEREAKCKADYEVRAKNKVVLEAFERELKLLLDRYKGVSIYASDYAAFIALGEDDQCVEIDL